jgi:hypothetical protein
MAPRRGDPRVVEPAVARLVAVNAVQRLPQPVDEENLAERLPLRQVGDAGVALEVVPAALLELGDERDIRPGRGQVRPVGP